MKSPFHWTSSVPKCYKKKVIIEDLHCVQNLSSNFEKEATMIKDNHIKAGYPFCFINSIIDNLNQEKEDLLVPTSLFEERKEIIFLIPFFCKQCRKTISRISDKLELFTNYKVKFRYFWKARKFGSLIVLKTHYPQRKRYLLGYLLM